MLTTMMSWDGRHTATGRLWQHFLCNR
jgi:hypothetical protein